jgi:hypothetical protein
MIPPSASSMIHVHDGVFKASAHKLIVYHSPQGTAVIDLKIGNLEFAIFPGERAGEIAAELASMAAQLAALAEELGAAKVLALND